MYIWEIIIREIKMKKVVLSLLVGGLSIGGDCFAVSSAFVDANSVNKDRVSYSEVKPESRSQRVGVGIKKTLKRKDVQIAISTAAIIGTGVFAYYRCAPFQGFVSNNASKVSDLQFIQKSKELVKASGNKVVGNVRSLVEVTKKGSGFVKNKVSGSISSLELKARGLDVAKNVKDWDDFVSGKIGSLRKIFSAATVTKTV